MTPADAVAAFEEYARKRAQVGCQQRWVMVDKRIVRIRAS